MKEYTLKLVSHSTLDLEKYCRLIIKIAIREQIILKGPIFLPLKKKSVVLLKAPHVYKTSREHFYMITHKRLFTITENDLKKNASFIKTIQNYLPAGISLKITRTLK